MKMKKILASIMAIIVITTMSTGCSNKKETNDSSSLTITETTSNEDSTSEESTKVTSDKEDTDKETNDEIDSKEENLEAKEIFEKTKENVDKVESLTLEMILSMDASYNDDEGSTTMSATSTSIIDLTKNTSHTTQNSSVTINGEPHQENNIEEYRIKTEDNVIIYTNTTGEWTSSESDSSELSNMKYAKIFDFNKYVDMTVEESEVGYIISMPISNVNDTINEIIGLFIENIDNVNGKIVYHISKDYYPTNITINTSEELYDDSTQSMSVKIAFNNWNEITDEDNTVPELVKANAVESSKTDETSNNSDIEKLDIKLNNNSIKLPSEIKVDSKWTKENDLSTDSIDFYSYMGSSLCLYYQDNLVNGISINSYGDDNLPDFTINGVGIGSTIEEVFKVFGEIKPSFDGDSFVNYTYTFDIDNKYYIIEFTNYPTNDKNLILDASIYVYS